jgi:hypothetical protein
MHGEHRLLQLQLGDVASELLLPGREHVPGQYHHSIAELQLPAALSRELQ